MITFKDFKKLELIVAKVKEVNDHPDADKLYLVKIDTGTEEKQIVAGIKLFYTKEDLVGRKVIVVNNLEPAVIRGEESQGMLLAVKDKEDMAILQTDKDVEIGCLVS